MRVIEVVNEASGKVIDVWTLDTDGVHFSTGLARDVYLAKRNHFGDDAETFAGIQGSSNGYTTFRGTDSTAR